VIFIRRSTILERKEYLAKMNNLPTTNGESPPEAWGQYNCIGCIGLTPILETAWCETNIVIGSMQK